MIVPRQSTRQEGGEQEQQFDIARFFSTPLFDLERGRLVVFSAISRLTLRAAPRMAELYQARFEGSTPEVKAKDGVISILYPRRLSSLLGGQQRAAEIMLNVAIPWQIAIQGGASDITVELGGLDLASLVVKGGVSSIRLELPMPSSVIPIHISGGASEIIVRRPGGVAARAHLKGWVSTFVFEDQTFSNMGNNARLQSSGFEPTAPHYDIEVASSAASECVQRWRRLCGAPMQLASSVAFASVWSTMCARVSLPAATEPLMR